MNSQQSPDLKLFFGESRTMAIQKLGKPTRVSKEFVEIEGDTAVVLHYSRSKLYFLHNELTDFELRDCTLAFGKNKQIFRVGDKLTIVRETSSAGGLTKRDQYLLNNSPMMDLMVDNKAGKSMNVNYTRIAHNSIRHGDTNTDAEFEVLFDANDNVISISVNQTN